MLQFLLLFKRFDPAASRMLTRARLSGAQSWPVFGSHATALFADGQVKQVLTPQPPSRVPGSPLSLLGFSEQGVWSLNSLVQLLATFLLFSLGQFW